MRHVALSVSLIGAVAKLVIRAATLAAMAPLLTACGEGVLSPHGPIGKAETVILFDATGIMLAVIVPVIVLTLVFAWWFRAGNTRARYLPNWEYSGRIEMIVWSIPALVILFLGGIAWIGSHDLDPPRAIESAANPVDIEVVSLDWKWLFIYPDQGIASVNRLVVPVDTPIHFRLTSSSVMNSFFVPELGSQIYTMPGMITQLNLLADQTGTYKGFSAQFSGDGFSDMRFEVAALAADGFAGWMKNVKAQGQTLDSAAYEVLARPSKDMAPATYAAVSKDLFENVSGGRMSVRNAPREEH